MRMKDYNELTIADDYMFCNVLSNYEDVCQGFLERILGREIGGIVHLSNQKAIKLTPDGHGVRFDIYLEDDKNTIYDIEMQTSHYEDIPLRSRYYQAMIDQAALHRGRKYKDLKNSIVIFIVLKDIFELGYNVYEFEERCNHDTSLKLNDGTLRLIVNAERVLDDASPELQNLIRYISTGVATDEFTELLETRVAQARKNSEWGDSYMTLQEKYNYIYEDALVEGREAGLIEGREAGLAEGREAGLAEGREAGLAEGRSIQAVKSIDIIVERYNRPLAEVCEAMGYTVEDYNAVKNSLNSQL